MSFRPLAMLAAPALAAVLSFAGTAAAEDAEPAAARVVVQPAPTLTDPKTGAQTVIVPKGCTAVKETTGRIVVLCPYAAPGAPNNTMPDQPESHPHTEKRWYGWEVLLVDGASLTASAVVMSAGNGGSLTGAGVAMMITGYALGGPIVHWSNGQVGRGFASLGMRVGAPLVIGFGGGLVGTVLGAAACNGGGGDCIAAGAGVGAVIGIIGGAAAAIAVDSSVLARKTVHVDGREEARAPKLQWMPTANYDSKRQAATFGLAGTF